MSYSGFWIRFAASVIDLILFGLFIFLLGALLDIAGVDVDKHQDLMGFIVLIMVVAYDVLFVASKAQATPGKILLDVYVGDKEGKRIGVLRSFFRYVVLVISCCLFPIAIISGLMVIFSQEKAGIHDLICKTRVFRGKVSN